MVPEKTCGLDTAANQSGAQGRRRSLVLRYDRDGSTGEVRLGSTFDNLDQTIRCYQILRGECLGEGFRSKVVNT